MISPEILEKIERWIDQASSEIILSEPGTDRSQFPLRDLLSSLADKTADEPQLAAFHQCAAAAVAVVEELMFAGNPYTTESLDILGDLASQFPQLLSDSKRLFVPPAGITLPETTTAEIAQPDPFPIPTQELPVVSPTVPKSEVNELATIDEGVDNDLLKEFVNEAAEHLDNIEHGVLFLEDNPDDVETIASIFRAFHTIKGGSGFLGITPVNHLAHELESMLELVRTGQLAVTRAVVELVLEGADTFRNYTNEIQGQLAAEGPNIPVRVPTEQLIAKVKALLANPAETVGKSDIAAPSAEVHVVSNRASSGPIGGMIKVDIQKFDALMDLVGELVIAQSLVARDPGLSSTQSQTLLRNMAQMGKITNGLQKAAMSLRMVPIRSTFQKMNRLVRDTAVDNGKFVDLILHGEDTEMDRTIVEELADPLLHMVRNSVDHGIEKPATREANGKSSNGTIRLAASHVGGNILVEISDDGAGLRADAILAKAIQRGMVPAGATPPDKEIYELIFAPGFSTAAKVTDLSGRGVGMDVVKRNISRLRGKIEIDSTAGAGTSFKIYLPLTLAIINGLMVSVGSQRYIIPTLSVRESFRPTPGMISTVYGQGEMVNVRGSLIPLLRLYDYFGITPRNTDPSQSMVVVVESAHEARCILVDDLLGQQEVVIKSLGDSFKNNRMLSGAAILGDGRVGLILDPRALVQIREFQTLKA